MPETQRHQSHVHFYNRLTVLPGRFPAGMLPGGKNACAQRLWVLLAIGLPLTGTGTTAAADPAPPAAAAQAQPANVPLTTEQVQSLIRDAQNREIETREETELTALLQDRAKLVPRVIKTAIVFPTRQRQYYVEMGDDIQIAHATELMAQMTPLSNRLLGIQTSAQPRLTKTQADLAAYMLAPTLVETNTFAHAIALQTARVSLNPADNTLKSNLDRLQNAQSEVMSALKIAVDNAQKATRDAQYTHTQFVSGGFLIERSEDARTFLNDVSIANAANDNLHGLMTSFLKSDSVLASNTAFSTNDTSVLTQHIPGFEDLNVTFVPSAAPKAMLLDGSTKDTYHFQTGLERPQFLGSASKDTGYWKNDDLFSLENLDKDTKITFEAGYKHLLQNNEPPAKNTSANAQSDSSTAKGDAKVNATTQGDDGNITLDLNLLGNQIETNKVFKAAFGLQNPFNKTALRFQWGHFLMSEASPLISLTGNYYNRYATDPRVTNEFKAKQFGAGELDFSWDAFHLFPASGSTPQNPAKNDITLGLDARAYYLPNGESASGTATHHFEGRYEVALSIPFQPIAATGSAPAEAFVITYGNGADEQTNFVSSNGVTFNIVAVKAL